MPFKVLNRSFVFLGRRARLKGAEIPSLAGLRILLPRIQSIAAGLKFPDHVEFSFTNQKSVFHQRADLRTRIKSAASRTKSSARWVEKLQFLLA